MAEYIEREAVRNALYEADAVTMDGVKILNQFPTADVVEVRHGEWVMRSNGYRVRRECSLCGKTTVSNYPYCPNCGAKMDGKD